MYLFFLGETSRGNISLFNPATAEQASVRRSLEIGAGDGQRERSTLSQSPLEEVTGAEQGEGPRGVTQVASPRQSVDQPVHLLGRVNDVLAR